MSEAKMAARVLWLWVYLAIGAFVAGQIQATMENRCGRAYTRRVPEAQFWKITAAWPLYFAGALGYGLSAEHPEPDCEGYK